MFFQCIFLPLLSNTKCPQLCCFIAGSFVLFHWSACFYGGTRLSPPESSVVYLRQDAVMPPAVFLLLVLAIYALFTLHAFLYCFFFFQACEIHHRNFDSHYIKSCKLILVFIFTVLILPVQDHEKGSFCHLVSANIFCDFLLQCLNVFIVELFLFFDQMYS